MADDTILPGEILDQAAAVAAVPPPPTIKTRPSIPHLIFGNLLYLGLVVAGLADWLSWWVATGIAALVGVFAVGLLEQRREKLRAQYVTFRLDEIEDQVTDPALRRAHVEAEIGTALQLAPIVGLIALPTYLLGFAVIADVFGEINHALDTWPWVFRWAVAGLAGAGSWIFFVLVWAFANQTPSQTEIDFEGLRRDEAETASLRPEDQNDIQIIGQITNLESLSKRIDTYTLESALLSALSFSSFVSIVLAERDHVGDLHRLFGNAASSTAVQQGIHLSSARALARDLGLVLEFVSQNLVALIGLSLLLCATTFLGVLVARLRFNEGYRDAENLVKVAERLNEKEEQALEAKDEPKAAIYAAAIANMLEKALKLERGLGITVSHMRISRDFGILFFVTALILCGLFFNGIVSTLIVTVFVGAVVVGYFDKLVRGLLRKQIFGPALLGSLSRQLRRPGP